MTDPTTSITAAGRRLELRWAGPPPEQAPTLVLLHEGLGSAGLWRDFPDKLAHATGFGVCAYSRAGYGGSDPEPLPWPITYMEDHASHALGPVLDAIGFRRGLLVGHSDGASIAALYAGTVSDPRVRGAVLMAPHFFIEDLCILAIREAKRAYESGDLRPRLERHHGANVDNAFYGWNASWLNPDFHHWDITDALHHIRVPLLVLQGLADPYGTRAQADTAAELCPAPVTCRLLAGIGHTPWREAESETLAAIATFAARLL
ncbi:MAG: alpha/beta hydrolase [Alphaproteobacteria bacterium]|nr:alpha/beta hydrolase [Alphaproteobacteria bacterium]MCB9931502.1 alpha/beta hydrolase [Alphaproteobacteria bacterium]